MGSPMGWSEALSRGDGVEPPTDPRRRSLDGPPRNHFGGVAQLPHDLAARVLATLPPHARARCATVCASWRRLMRELPPEQLWRELDFTTDPSAKVRACPVVTCGLTARQKRHQMPTKKSVPTLYITKHGTRVFLTRPPPSSPSLPRIVASVLSPQVTRDAIASAVAMADGKLRVLKVPGDAGIPRSVLVNIVRAHRESLHELHAHSSPSSGDGGDLVGAWTPKQVHAAISAAGPKFRRLAVDVKSRGVSPALVQQLASPLVRVRRLEVRAATLGDVEKAELFSAVARLRGRASEMARSSSCVSLSSSFGFGAGAAGGDDGEAEARGDSLRRLTLASCGLTRDDVVSLKDAVTAGEDRGGHPLGLLYDREDARLEEGADGSDVETPSWGSPLELELPDNPGVGSGGVVALAPLIASGAIVSLNLENCGLGEAGAEALGAALASPHCALESLNVARNFIGPRGAAAVAEGLARGAAARAAAAGNRTHALARGREGTGTWGEEEEAGGHHLRRSDVASLANVKELSMGHNAFGCAGAIAFAAAAARGGLSALETLDISMNGIGVDGVTALAKAMLAAPPPSRRGGVHDVRPASPTDGSSTNYSSRVKTLRLTPGAEVVRGTPALRDLQLQGNPLGVGGARAFATAAASGGDDERTDPDPAFPSLEFLGLSSTRIGAMGAVAVAEAVANPASGLRGLTHLDLSANDIGTCGASLFLKSNLGEEEDAERDEGDEDEGGVGKRKSAAGADGCGDGFDATAGHRRLGSSSPLTAFAEALASAPRLRRLDLGYNSLGDAGAEAVAAVVTTALGGLSLAELDLQRNAIGDLGAKILADALEGCADEVGGSLPSSGACLRGAPLVDLRSNAIGPAGMAALEVHVAAGRVASNFMPTRWVPPPQARSEGGEGAALDGPGASAPGALVEVA